MTTRTLTPKELLTMALRNAVTAPTKEWAEAFGALAADIIRETRMSDQDVDHAKALALAEIYTRGGI